MQDYYHWQVTYRDATLLSEIDDEGQEHGWAEVDGTRVTSIALFAQSSASPLVHVVLPAGARARFWRRRTIAIFPDGRQITSTVTVLGWDVAGHEALLWLDEEGGIAMTPGEDV